MKLNLLCLFILVIGMGQFALADSVELTKEAPEGPIVAGETFTYRLLYRCAGITENCENVQVIDVLPPEVEFVSANGSIHAPDVSELNGVVTFDFIPTLLAGSTGELTITVRFPNGYTPDGEAATNTADIDGTNTDLVTSNPVTTTASAAPDWYLTKSLSSGAVTLGDTATYSLTLCDNSGNGKLHLTNVSFIDTLPAGVIFDAASDGGVYDAGTHTVNWTNTLDTAFIGNCYSRMVDVVFPVNAFTDGEAVENVACVQANPLGNVSQIDYCDTITHIVQAPTAGAALTKSRDGDIGKLVGEAVEYDLTVRNSGDIALNNFILVDTIPVPIDLYQVSTGAYDNVPNGVTVSYQTNLNTTWTVWGTTDGSTDTFLDTTGLNLAANEYITMVQWDFGTVPANFNDNNDINVRGNIISPDQEGNPVDINDTFDNTAYLSYEFNGEITTINASAAINIRGPQVSPDLSKSVSGSAELLVGDSLVYNISAGNSGEVELTDIVVVDTIPAQVDIFRVSSGVYNNAPIDITISYQTNLNTTWTSWGTTDGTTNASFDTTGFNLAANEYITVIQWELDTLPIGGTNATAIDVVGTIINPDNEGNAVNPTDVFTNCADLIADYDYDYAGTNYTGTDSLQSCTNVTIRDASASAYLAKTEQDGVAKCIGDTIQYNMNTGNNGDVDLVQYTITDTLPAEVELYQASVGAYDKAPFDLTLRYQTNLNTTWTDWGMTDGSTEQAFHINSLTLGTGEYITMLQWEFDTIPANTTHTNGINLFGQIISPNHNGDPITAGGSFANCAQLSYIYNADTTTQQSCVDVTIKTREIALTKTIDGDDTIYPGQAYNYLVFAENPGETPMHDFILIDTLPAQFDFTKTESGGWSNAPNTNLVVRYQTNLNTTWTDWPDAPYDGSTDEQLEKTDLTLAANEYVTMVMWDFGIVPGGFTHNGKRPRIYGTLLATDRNGNPVNTDDVFDNCATLSANTNGDTLAVRKCTPVTVVAPPVTEGMHDPSKAEITSGPYLPGDTIVFTLRAKNDEDATDTLVNPILMDLLPPELDFVDGSWAVTTNTANAPTPIFEELSNYNNIGRTLLRWSWEGTAAHVFDINEYTLIEFKTVLKLGAKAGTLSNTLYQTSNFADYPCEGGTDVDENDLDGDGDTAEELCKATQNFVVQTVAALESEKLVKGQLDSAYSKFPESGLTVPGGTADYQLYVRNPSTVAFTDIVVIDILPFVGDSGVIVSQPRLTEWRPNLVAPVATPAGVTVYYSTASNPCRPEVVPDGPASCEAPNWSTVPPADITTVQSIKFEFGDIVLEPGDELLLEWPMRAPVSAPTSGEIAWNSFGYAANRADNGNSLLPSEPIKVGIEIQPISPAAYGNYVWFDTNQDGLQDAGELGVSGVRVELYMDNGDGISDPTNDTFVNFTLTDADGLYVFPDLPIGDYYAVFYPPPTYTISPLNANANADEEVDSDGVPSTFNGVPVAIAPVTNLEEGEFDYTWDLGIFQDDPPTAALGNYVWFDKNNDGMQNESNADGINGVTVNLYIDVDGDGLAEPNGDDNTPVATTLTTNDINGSPGYYLFDDLVPGTPYFVEFVLPNGATFTTQGATGADDPEDSDPDINTGLTEVITLGNNEYNSTWDAGIILPTGNLSLGNHVWLDADTSGTFNTATEMGINGVKVNLYIDANNDGIPDAGEYYATTTTFTQGGDPGFYLFDNLPEGNFIVQIDPANFNGGGVLDTLISTIGNDDANGNAPDPDDDVNFDDNGQPVDGYGVISFPITLSNGGEPDNDGDTDINSNLSVDFGFISASVVQEPEPDCLPDNCIPIQIQKVNAP